METGLYGSKESYNNTPLQQQSRPVSVNLMMFAQSSLFLLTRTVNSRVNSLAIRGISVSSLPRVGLNSDKRWIETNMIYKYYQVFDRQPICDLFQDNWLFRFLDKWENQLNYNRMKLIFACQQIKSYRHRLWIHQLKTKEIF